MSGSISGGLVGDVDCAGPASGASAVDTGDAGVGLCLSSSDFIGCSFVCDSLSADDAEDDDEAVDVFPLPSVDFLLF